MFADAVCFETHFYDQIMGICKRGRRINRILEYKTYKKFSNRLR